MVEQQTSAASNTSIQARWSNPEPSGVDLSIFHAMPSVAVTQSGELDELPVDHRRYLLARDGVYLEVRSQAMYVRIRLAEIAMPYGPVSESIELAGGPLPLALLSRAVAIAQDMCPNECAFTVSYDAERQQYALRSMPYQEASPAHVSYVDDVEDTTLVLDLHSHARAAAFFSGTDDESDLSRQGPYFALVIGRCGQPSDESTEIAVRFCCSPVLVPLRLDALMAWGVFQ